MCAARITPACAGITHGVHGGRGRCEDHPRVCGNYERDRVKHHEDEGSPPRVRELHVVCIQDVRVRGITPACAGITCGLHLHSSPVQDHPRVCGNYLPPIILMSLCVGSPPRVRELLMRTRSWSRALRITPACAGITPMTSPILAMSRDHPRVCGNYVLRDYREVMGLGSPPRVRELH